MNVKRYIINYSRLVIERIPIELRYGEVMAYVLVLANPFVDLYGRFLSFRNQIIYRILITPQVVYLEKLLNDRYDPALKRIYIKDGQEYLPINLYTKAELKPAFLYRKSELSKPKNYLYTKGEVSAFTYDFVIYVPISISFNLNEMTALINSYKLPSVFFTIETF